MIPVPRPTGALHAIYTAALRRPHGGYAASDLFHRAPNNCPKCAGPLFVRVRFHTVTPIGAVCPDCDWRTTYPLHPPSTGRPFQLSLNFTRSETD